MVWFCNEGECHTVNSEEYLCCKMCGTKHTMKLNETDKPKEVEPVVVVGGAPQVTKVLCRGCEVLFFTIYDDRIKKRMCGTCMPENESNAIKVKDWEKK